jgi:metallo-beta-lactamase family protein
LFRHKRRRSPRLTRAAVQGRKSVQLSFHGADRTVTGSCHLIECAGKRILVDCGLFQGGRELEEENSRDFGFDPAAIDVLLLTHAHLDHCGRIPLLARRGFKGEIIATSATRELARLVMLDSARLQEEDAAHRQRHRQRDGEPLYSTLDAMNSLDFFGRVATYDTPIDLFPGVRVTYFDAGHILGSASLFLELEENGVRRRLTMSGDIGNAGLPLMRDPVPPPLSDVVVMESTYGDRDHKPFPPSVEEFYGAVEDTFRRGGNVIIPTFALERAQELLYVLHEAIASKRLPADIQVFLDSPMAISATEVFRRHPDCLAPAAVEMFRDHDDPLSLPGLHLVHETADSIALNKIGGGAIIMAGSGMATGGRVRHHLRHNLWRAAAGIVFVGFASPGTLARQIIDGATTVRIFDEDVPVKAKIYTVNGFSAHAGQSELVRWHAAVKAPRTFLVHGEEVAMTALAGRLANTKVEMPALGATVAL